MKSFMKYALIGLPIVFVLLAIVALAMYVPTASVILFWVIMSILGIGFCFAVGYAANAIYKAIRGR